MALLLAGIYASFMLGRKIQRLVFIAVAALTLCACAGSAQNTPQEYARFDGGLTTLDGRWAFHLGDDKAWASPSFDDSGWEKLSVDAPWGAQGHANTAGYGWYRWRLRLAPGQAEPQQLAILLPHVEDAYEVYWNGRLVGAYGKLPPHPVWYYEMFPRTFDLGPAQDGVLVVRVWKCPFNSFDTGLQGGFYQVPEVGSPKAIDNELAKLDYHWLQSRQFYFGLHALYALVAVFGFLMWLRDRSQWVGFWMGCFAACKPLALLLLGLRLPFSEVFAMGWNQPVYVLGDVSLWFLLVWLLNLHDDRRLVKLVRILAVIDFVEGIVDGLTTIDFTLPNPVPGQVIDGALMPLVMALELLPIYLIGLALWRRQRLDPARWAVALLAFVFQSVFVVSVSLQQFGRFTHWTLGQKITAPLFTVMHNPVNLNLLTGVLLLVALVYAVYRASVESRRQQARLEHEMRNAREVQQVLVPEAIPAIAGFTIQSVYRPAGEVGGDFFQILPLAGGGVLVVIGDVSGKGMPAAMTVSLLVGTVRTLAHYTQSPGEILAAMNQRMLGRTQGGFTTCLILRADLDGNLTVANAGHLAPYMNGEELTVEGGLPLGLDAEAEYHESRFDLKENERLTLVTDGVVEARGKTGELFGFDRAAALSKKPADDIAQAAEDFGQDDDITVLSLMRQGLREQARSGSSATLQPA
ncbi:MAG TPA: SpoIIE family protein phosphatase [Terracidiphilus sp.]